MTNNRYWLEKWKMMMCFSTPMKVCDEFLPCDDGCRYAYDTELIDTGDTGDTGDTDMK